MINRELGFYVCDGKEFSSKILAMLYSNQVNKPIEWIFNDRIFQSYDWTIEPQESLDQLYDRRARQLREKYDYIIISYSGGADSHNMLMSFVRQGLHVDEIIVNQFEKAGRKFIDLNPNNKLAKNAGAEHYLQTLPRLKELSSLIPKTTITIADLSDHIFDVMESAGDASWILSKREGINPAGATRFNYLHLAEVRKRFDKEKSICLILGIEKPRTVIYKGRLKIRFIDRAANQVTVAEHVTDYDNCTVEFFYWNPDSVPMLIKQGHVIKRYLTANPHMQQHWHSSTATFESFRLIHERVLRPLLYTTWNDNWWQADKAVLDWHSEFDSWFEHGYSDTNAVSVWKEGIKYVREQLPTFIKEGGDGFKVFYKIYDLGPVPGLLPIYSQ
jgi:hypothetical protein